MKHLKLVLSVLVLLLSINIIDAAWIDLCGKSYMLRA